MSDIQILVGDMYCPRCWGLNTRLEMHISHGDKSEWDCDRCGYFEWPFEADKVFYGRFTWIWDDEHPSPNPGCPWCRTRNIQWGEGDHWSCKRPDCRKTWKGYWYRTNGKDWRTDRWKIKVPVSEVPWASGTVADLECARQCHVYDFTPGVDRYGPTCCRWPKSCSAFDPGFKTGKGPTTLPIIWNDGFGWRSGPPDVTKIPEHLFEQIWTRWMDTILPETLEVNDDAGCGQGCEYICRCYLGGF